MTILNNTEFSFNYSTLINDPNVNNAGTNGEYDFENANITLRYTTPEDEKTFNWLNGYEFVRIDNDNDFFTGAALNEGSKKVNSFAIRTSFGQFGYQEGEEIDTFTGNNKSISNFFYKAAVYRIYNLGNNILIIPQFRFLIDSDSNGFIQVELDIEKFLGKSKKYVGFGNYTKFTLNLGNSNATDIESYLTSDFYAQGLINNFGGSIGYNLGQIKFKGPNVETTEDPQGLSFGFFRSNNVLNRLETDLKGPNIETTEDPQGLSFDF